MASIIEISQKFLLATKLRNSTKPFIEALRGIQFDKLQNELTSDKEKKAFWINIYNAFVQCFVINNPESYKDRKTFYRGKSIQIAGHQFSLDDIEHGILRRSKMKLALGYLNKLMVSRPEKLLRVSKVDPRIHFALNCGAKSCPPIRFYEVEKLEAQLDLATLSYLEAEVQIDQDENTIFLPAIFNWFRGDFNGTKGIKDFLKRYEQITGKDSLSMKFKPYDWSLHFDNFRE
ncbi:DUF547 domain-containing protein [Fulvivirgaceae bacterium BMA10]|uniref:DUF547 domain-containing protein n=1 Tax=Splendidivirga corallicola TaxID=3051826 RepID=A0ABT8KJA8_9BACT|nr:DUF547 domain-containing protein [Fulvivirgaceae bacterium BMA10]